MGKLWAVYMVADSLARICIGITAEPRGPDRCMRCFQGLTRSQASQVRARIRAMEPKQKRAVVRGEINPLAFTRDIR